MTHSCNHINQHSTWHMRDACSFFQHMPRFLDPKEYDFTQERVVKTTKAENICKKIEKQTWNLEKWKQMAMHAEHFKNVLEAKLSPKRPDQQLEAQNTASLSQ